MAPEPECHLCPTSDHVPGSAACQRKPGSKLESFIIDRLLGLGGQGHVWLVHSETNERETFALKEFAMRSGMVSLHARATREVQCANALDHPHIVKLKQHHNFEKPTANRRPILLWSYVVSHAVPSRASHAPS